MRQQIFRWLFAIQISIACIFCFHSPAKASVSASGEFTATRACQAYQSMKQKTNPGDVQLEVGKVYPIFEMNVPNGTTWYRLKIQGAEPVDRWAYFECGTAEVNNQGDSSGENHGGQTTCKTAGLADSYVFALSWQPAFCESHRDKPECSVSDPSAFQAGNFTLHGLWPNKKSCGTNYGFCGKYKKEVSPFCNYDPVPMQAATLQELGEVMPSAAHGSCLQRHEWFKHGTCQKQWDADGYYHTAIHLVKEFNRGGMAAFMQANIGKTVTAQSFFDAMDKAFSDESHLRLQISCSGGKLVDVYISLPVQLPAETSLKELIRQGEPNFKNTCGPSFEVDAIGQ
jgi:ribonuclease T2